MAKLKRNSEATRITRSFHGVQCHGDDPEVSAPMARSKHYITPYQPVNVTSRPSTTQLHHHMGCCSFLVHNKRPCTLQYFRSDLDIVTSPAGPQPQCLHSAAMECYYHKPVATATIGRCEGNKHLMDRKFYSKVLPYALSICFQSSLGKCALRKACSTPELSPTSIYMCSNISADLSSTKIHSSCFKVD